MRFIQVFLFSLILFFTLNVNAQKQMLGGGLGYTFNSPSENYKYYGDLNVNYLLGLKNFAIKAKINLQPSTSFGLNYQFLVGAGLTTKLEKKLSFHAIAGACYANCTNYNYNEGSAMYKYDFSGSFFLDMGFYYKLKRNDNFYFGLETYYWYESVTRYYSGFRQYESLIVPHITCGLSANYLFGNKQKKTP